MLRRLSGLFSGCLESHKMPKVFCRELQTNDGKVDESDPDGDLLRIFFRSLPRVAGGVFKFQPGEMESIFGDTTCRFLRYQDSCSPKTHGFLKILGRYSHLQSPKHGLKTSNSTWCWSGSGDLQWTWGSLSGDAQTNITDKLFFQTMTCFFLLLTFPLKIAAAKRRSEAGRQLINNFKKIFNLVLRSSVFVA